MTTSSIKGHQTTKHKTMRLSYFLLVFFVLICGFQTISAMGQSVTLWSRGNLGYLIAGRSMPLWPQLPSDALPLGKTLILTLRMPLGFEVVCYDSARDFAVNPTNLIIPTGIDSFSTGSNVTYRVYLPVPPVSGTVRPALLVSPGSNPAGTYTIYLGLQTTDASKVWSDAPTTITVLPSLQNKTPRRMMFGVYDYADYSNPVFKSAIASADAACGMNVVANMQYYNDTDTVAQQLRNQGVKSGWVWFWSKNTSAILATHPEAKMLNSSGGYIASSLSYTWCIQNKELATSLLANYIQSKTSVCKYDIIINDIEETAYSNGTVYGDLYTPATIELFRSRAGIPSTVTLTPAVIASTYSSQWVDFRCWQSLQMSQMLADAIKSVDPSISYGVYSGYICTDTKNSYSCDWSLMGGQTNLDFGTAGYYGSTSSLTATASALNGIPFIPSEMFVENFNDNSTAMPAADNFAYRLMKSIMYGGGKAGVMVWYNQVLDSAAYSAMDRVSAVLAKIEDLVLDQPDRDSDLTKYVSFSNNDLFVYQMGTKRVVVAFNNSTTSSKTMNFKWNKAVHGSTVELISGTVMADPATLTGTLAPASFAVFVTGEESRIDTFSTYALDELQLASAGKWVKTGINSFQVKDPDGNGNQTARMGPWYWGDGAYYTTNSLVGTADYTAGVDFAAAPEWGGIDDDGRIGIFARRQSNGDSVFARIYIDTNRSGDTAPTSASLTFQVNGADYAWASNVPISYLQSNKGHIELTLDGQNVHAEAFWGTTYFISKDFVVSDDLLNAGPAGIYGYETNGNYYYCVVDMDNFSIVADQYPGDANGDGGVDVGDLGILAANYGRTGGATWAEGDFNGDGAVDVGDLGILAAHYGEGVSGSVDFNADYAKVFGTAETNETKSVTNTSSDETSDAAATPTEEETVDRVCSGLGVPLLAGLALLGLLLVNLGKMENISD